jgi:ribose 5-phosphate isomerase A
LSSIQQTLERLFGNAHIKLRMATPSDKAGPVVTDNGNLILDCDFGPLNDSAMLYKEIKCLSGVLDVGLFCNMATTAYIGRLEVDEGYSIVKKVMS